MVGDVPRLDLILQLLLLIFLRGLVQLLARMVRTEARHGAVVLDRRADVVVPIGDVDVFRMASAGEVVPHAHHLPGAQKRCAEDARAQLLHGAEIDVLVQQLRVGQVVDAVEGGRGDEGRDVVLVIMIIIVMIIDRGEF